MQTPIEQSVEKFEKYLAEKGYESYTDFRNDLRPMTQENMPRIGTKYYRIGDSQGMIRADIINDIILSISSQSREEGRKEGREEALREEKASKDGAYKERDMLVCALSKIFPSYLARHSDEDKEWENEWRWIVYITLPTGQVSWHIHDSEREMFNHLEVKENNWDGHNTQRKYERLQALSLMSKEK